MTFDEIKLAQKLINNLAIGDIKSATEIYKNKWNDIENPKQFGIKFKKAILDGILKNIIHNGIRNNGRCDEYERI